MATNREPKSAEELAEQFDVSLPTIYRRTNKLIEFDLLTDHLRADQAKNQYKVFEATLKRITFEIDDEGYQVKLQTNPQVGEQFGAFWTDLGESTPDNNIGDRAERNRKVDRSRGNSRFTDPS